MVDSTNTYRINGYRVRKRQLKPYFITQRRVRIENSYEDQNSLIEQSAAAQISLIEYSYSVTWKSPLKNPGYTPSGGSKKFESGFSFTKMSAYIRLKTKIGFHNLSVMYMLV